MNIFITNAETDIAGKNTVKNTSKHKKGIFKNMKMKKSFFLLVLALTAAVLACAVSASTLSPALDVIADSCSVTVSGICGENVVFDRGSFTGAAGDGTYDGIRIVSLPDSGSGTLYYNDAEICTGQVIPFEKIDCVSFVPKDGAKSASFEFTFDGAYTVPCSIVYKDSVNNAPTASGCPYISTFVSTNCSGAMRGADPDGDRITFEVTKYPESGKLTYSAEGGDFIYNAPKSAGAQSFSYRVRDEYGSISEEAEVVLDVTERSTKLDFSDVSADSCRKTAACAVCDAGVMSYTEENGEKLFNPTEKTSRLEFLVGLMDACGAKNLPTAPNTGFADSDEVAAEYRSYVYSASKLGIINGIKSDAGMCFMPDEPITKAQAAVMVNSIIGYEAERDASYGDSVPAWAESSVDALYEIGVIDTAGGEMRANDTLTRADAAQILYNVMTLIYE